MFSKHEYLETFGLIGVIQGHRQLNLVKKTNFIQVDSLLELLTTCWIMCHGGVKFILMFMAVYSEIDLATLLTGDKKKRSLISQSRFQWEFLLYVRDKQVIFSRNTV